MATRAHLAAPPGDLVDFGAAAIRGRHAEAKLWSLEAISDESAARAAGAPNPRR